MDVVQADKMQEEVREGEGRCLMEDDTAFVWTSFLLTVTFTGFGCRSSCLAAVLWSVVLCSCEEKEGCVCLLLLLGFFLHKCACAHDLCVCVCVCILGYVLCLVFIVFSSLCVCVCVGVKEIV